MPIAITPSLSPGPFVNNDRRILYIDAYDSFSNSIVGLLEQSLNVEVAAVRIDDKEASRNLEIILEGFDAVVVGPGPGHPATKEDVGLIDQLWSLEDGNVVPIFGICLGFQSLCLAHGAEVKRLGQARHGIVSKIHHNGADIFENINGLRAAQYHSLGVDLGAINLHGQPVAHSYWKPTSACPKLRPLAWDTEDDINGPVLMSVAHTEKPFWGVQFHPESICTSKEGAKMMQNWWKQAEAWLTARQRSVVKDRELALRHITPVTVTRSTRQINTLDRLHGLDPAVSELDRIVRSSIGNGSPMLRWAKHSAGCISPVAIVEALGLTQDEVVLLDSQGYSMGRFSILGIVIPDQTVKITYRCWDRTLRYGNRSGDEHIIQLHSIDHVWPMLQEVLDLQDPRRRQNGSGLPYDSPFWGGFMGYISYESGLETINVDLHESSATSRIPDINFAFIHRSIVIDHVAGKTYVQSLSPDDSAWISEVETKIDSLVRNNELRKTSPSRKPGEEQQTSLGRKEVHELEKRLSLSQITTPQEPHYRNKVLKCQQSLAAGDSYELCLTDETLISIAKPNSSNIPLNPWALYKKLRRKNPAPYGAFLRLPNATLIGTSPERFLKWTRTGHCEFRPIKGTVKKDPSMTREKAHNILNSSKERAENLMIVDLIRHDLSGVVGARNCRVSKLMTIEEYEHVYQLVSVIEGQLPGGGDEKGLSGLDVLKASLPPGSMTGAPKKRSCEILRDIEKRARGIYSGVLGYLDVGGGGDFSVVIRTAVRDAPASSNSIQGVWAAGSSNGSTPSPNSRSSSPDFMKAGSDDIVTEQIETWRIGAGGAVTIQSTDEGEFLEMEAKVMTALTAFQSA